MPSLPGALLQASESMALLSSLMVGGKSNSTMVVMGIMFSVIVYTHTQIYVCVFICICLNSKPKRSKS